MYRLLKFAVFFAGALLPYSVVADALNLSQETGEIHLRGENMAGLVLSACTKLNIRIAFEQDLNGGFADTPVTIDRASGTVADLLDEIVHLRPNYTWKETSGIVHVMPEKGDLLSELKLPDFVADHESRSQFFFHLTGDESLKRWAEARNLQIFQLYNYSGPALLEQREQVSIPRDETNNLGRTLDQALLQRGRRFWSITIVKLDSEQLYIGFSF